MKNFIYAINKKFYIIGFITLLLIGCDGLIPIEGENNPTDNKPYETGQDYNSEMNTLRSTPMDLSIVTLSEGNVKATSSSIMLYDYIPPVRSQGRYGTCTAWGIGYYARTIMYAREHNLTKTDLENPNNVFSPKYLFLATEHRGNNCNGSNPYYAFKAMQNRGIATWQAVPYEDLGTCSDSPTSDWNNNASKYKIENFRRIDPTDKNALKMYISMGRPMQISCNLGQNFFSINDEVLYDDNYSTDVSEHLYHTMCLIGYDDDKGANGAFRIVNSWGENWGDAGFAWIDYNFFSERFCYAAYVIEGDKGGLSDGLIDQNVINPSMIVDGKDLITIEFEDNLDSASSNKRDRTLTYNVFNKGSEIISASQDWNIVYYYYNAYDPENDYGIILYDYYTDDVGKQYIGQNNDFDSISVKMNRYGIFNWWNYVDVPSGWSVAKSVYPDDGYDYDFEFHYTVPDITGDYYFVLMADGFNGIEEQYEQNNYMFFTGANKKPLKISNGIVDGSSLSKIGKQTAHAGELKKGEPNTYSIEEISSLIKFQKQTGILDVAARKFKHNSSIQSSSLRLRQGKKLIKAVLKREM